MRKEDQAEKVEQQAESKVNYVKESLEDLKARLNKYSKDENMLFYCVAAILAAVGLVICGLIKCLSASRNQKPEYMP